MPYIVHISIDMCHVCICVHMYTHMYVMESYSSIKRNKQLFMQCNMDMFLIMTSERSQVKKKKVHTV